MTDDTWTPGEDDDTSDDEEVRDGDEENVVSRRGKTRIEASRSPGRSGRGSRSFVVRKGRLDTSDTEEDE